MSRISAVVVFATAVLVATGVAGAATTEYSSGNLASAVPDNDPAGVESAITVADPGQIVSVRVDLRIGHTSDGDVEIYLVHPDGTTVLLSSDNGKTGDDYGSGAADCSGTLTSFADAYPGSIFAAGPPFAGSYKPESPLGTLAGKPANGDWKLRVVDDYPSDTGTLFCWKLILTTASTGGGGGGDGGDRGCTITGTAGNDVLSGTVHNDVICGLGGDDKIFGLGGNDVLYGDAGDDSLFGGNRGDRLEGGAGNDALNGEKGDDRLYGGAGDDVLDGGPGFDNLTGNRGRDRMNGGTGRDYLDAKDGQRDVVDGGPEFDRAKVDRRRDQVISIARLL
jgi:subtilisin-like proprotein convertase family protein